MIYLDHAATTPMRREVLEAMWPYLTEQYGNPSSLHPHGESAREALAQARRQIAAVLGCRASELTFTSGGTEADNLALKGIALANPRGRHLVVSTIEHEAVLASAAYLQRHHGFELTEVAVDGYGSVEPAAFAAALRPDTTLCSIMLANNEIGTIQPVAELATIAHIHGIPFHTDAVQAGGLLPLSLSELQVDAMSLSGHKFGGPKGIGLLYARNRIELEPLLHGGGQERGRRSGTENVAGAVGFACGLTAGQANRQPRADQLCRLRDQLIDGVLHSIPQARLTGHPSQRLPNVASFCFPGLNGETLLLRLVEQEIFCSSGSACAAGSEEPSHVLLALGMSSDIARTAVRFSLGEGVTAAEITRTIAETTLVCQAVCRMRT